MAEPTRSSPPALRPRAPGDERPRLIAVDWGTTSLRGVLIDAQGHVAARRALPQGITQVEGDFAAAFTRIFGDWLALSPDLCLLSGMIGSRQGWQEAPYCPCPAGFEALSRHLVWLPPVSDVPLAIVPGVCLVSPDGVDPVDRVPDVMRGEEIQVMGALRHMPQQDGLLVLPGTHSKWVTVQAGAITRFQTCMTGELYAVLSQHTILGRTTDTEAPLDETAFLHGVRRGLQAPALSQLLFGVRTLSLFDALTPAASASYLSGLLIGQELRDQCPTAGQAITLIGNEALVLRYRLALSQIACTAVTFGDEATWSGHQALYAYLLESRP